MDESSAETARIGKTKFPGFDTNIKTLLLCMNICTVQNTAIDL